MCGSDSPNTQGNRVRIKVYLNTAIDAEWREEYKSRTGRDQRKWLAEKIAEYDAIDRVSPYAVFSEATRLISSQHARLCKDWVLIKREEDKESLFKERQVMCVYSVSTSSYMVLNDFLKYYGATQGSRLV